MNNDAVNHQAHYTDGNIEVIDFIEDKGLNFHLGNAVKYISQAGKKDPDKTLQDLEKARWSLDREITKRKTAIANAAPVEPLNKMDEIAEALADGSFQSNLTSKVMNVGEIKEQVGFPLTEMQTPISDAVKNEVYRFWERILRLPIDKCTFIFTHPTKLYVAIEAAFAFYQSFKLEPRVVLNHYDFMVAVPDVTPGHVGNVKGIPDKESDGFYFLFDRTQLRSFFLQQFGADTDLLIQWL